MAFSVKLNIIRYNNVSLPISVPSPSYESVTPFFSASGVRSVKISSSIGASSTVSLQRTVRSALISSRIFVICDMRSVCSCKSLRNSAVSGSASACSTANNSICACMSASGVRNSCAAFPVNCRCAVKPSSKRSIILLKELLNCLNSGSTSSLTFISDKLFGCTCSICAAKLRKGFSA